MCSWFYVCIYACMYACICVYMYVLATITSLIAAIYRLKVSAMQFHVCMHVMYVFATAVSWMTVSLESECNTFIHGFMYVCMHACYVCICNSHVMNDCHISLESECNTFIHGFMYACMYACMYVRICNSHVIMSAIYRWKVSAVYIFMFLLMYVCMYVCMCS